MAKLSAHGTEIARYFDPRQRALMAVHADGVTLYRSLLSGGWKLFARKKAEVALADWQRRKLAYIASLPVWCREVRCLPSEQRLNEWASDSVCETPTGDTVEPDGHGRDGAPSWLLALGMI